MEFTFVNWGLAVLPVLLLLCGILLFKWESAKAGAVSFVAAAAVAWLAYGADFRLLVLASSKGMSLSLYILLIIWAAVFLYNIADRAGAIKKIGNTLQTVTSDKLMQCLIFCWCFTSALQGLAGFGVPVAVVAPIMVVMGYPPLFAAAACLVGHSWSISFGSMGSSYNAIQLVTGIPGETIGPVMALLFAVAIFTTGFGVAHIYGGFKAVKEAFAPILVAGSVMTGGMWFMNYINTAQLASLVAAMLGCLVLMIWSRCKQRAARKKTPPAEEIKERGMSFVLACAPYLLLIGFSIAAQIPVIKSALQPFYLGLDYPALQTALHYEVAAEAAYSKIQIFSHPAPLLLFSTIIGFLLYMRLAKVDKGIIKPAAKATVDKCIPTSVGIAFMVMMALIMVNSGMTNLIAQGIAKVFQGYYGLLTPFIGVLGTFITGSNTNSNIMFGALQYDTALLLGKSGILFAAAQSLGGSIGVAISPSAIVMGTSNVGLSGRESDVLRITIRYCLLAACLSGIVVWILS